MNRFFLKSKLHNGCITGADPTYAGSITLPRDLMELADILPNEQVDVYNITNGERLTTYVIPGKSGEIVMNGAAAHRGSTGDRVIICTYASVPEEMVHQWQAFIVILDEENQVVSMEKR